MARPRTRAAAPVWLHTLCLLVCVWSQVDVDECKDLQSQYGVSAMPTFKMLKKGKEVRTHCTPLHPRRSRTPCHLCNRAEPSAPPRGAGGLHAGR